MRKIVVVLLVVANLLGARIANAQTCPTTIPYETGYWWSNEAPYFVTKSWVELANFFKSWKEAWWASIGHSAVLILYGPTDGTVSPMCFMRFVNGVQQYGPGGSLCAEPLQAVQAVGDFMCPFNYKLGGGGCIPKDAGTPQVCPKTVKELGPRSYCSAGINPISQATGNKYQEEIDYIGLGPFPLVLKRHYNSIDAPASKLGKKWRHSYERLTTLASIYGSAVTRASAVRPDGRTLYFTLNASNWIPDGDVTDQLTRLFDGSGNPAGWKLVTGKNDEIEIFDVVGRLISITNRAGLTQTLQYNAQDRLATVTDHVGRTLTFGYNTAGQVSSVTDPNGKVITYGYGPYSYGGNPNLISVKYPDVSPSGKTKIYHYENATFPNALTGITDENGQRFSTYAYDARGRAISSEHAGGVNKFTLSYAHTGNSVTEFIDSGLHTTRVYSFQTIQNTAQNTSISGSPCPAAGNKATSFNANGFPVQTTDWNDNVTTYQRNDTQGRKDLETQRVEASNRTVAEGKRIIETQWHSVFRLPTQITEKDGNGVTLRQTVTTHDVSGNVLSKTVTDVPSATNRAWAYTYDAEGRVLTVNGPRTDVSDITTYTYFPNNATCTGVSAIGCRGQVATISNALGHVTSITEYNVHGQPLSITSPNGLVTTLTYDPRMRLTSRNVGGEVTTYEYDGAGQLTRVTLPDGSFLQYVYDAAHRLTEISDNLGNRIVYTLDFKGNRKKEDVYDPGNTLAQTRSRVFNALNRLVQEIGAQGQTTAYSYDNQGNLTSMDGPLASAADTTVIAYDALNRLIRVTDPNSGQVNYGYNSLDQLTSVSDPRSLVTSYTYDGLNNLNQQASPDTGTTVNTYDAAGNVLTQLDAKGQTTTYTYDALNRVTSITYQGGVVHSYAYDQGTNGLGRLTQITEPNSTTTYVYDQKGRLTTETRTINSIAYVTGYSYDSAGRLSGMTYPSGRTIAYTFDSLGRIQGISTTQGGAQTVISGVTYHPFGSVSSFTFGNSQTYTRGFDADGRVASYSLGAQSFAVGYDAASRISFISETGNPPNTNTYGYDLLDRLTSTTLPGTPYAFSYDSVGNRLTKTVGANTEIYTPAVASNRLASINPSSGPVRTYTHDANGAVTADGMNTYTYDTRGRLLQSVSLAGTTNYKVNAVGQRIRKTDGSTDTVYHYDNQGKLIAETTAAGTLQREYVYLGDMPVAVLDGAGTIAFIHSDHLNTPRLIANSSSQSVWRWDQTEPFGADLANGNPSGLGNFEFNLRLPGQYFDKETNLHYNYYRDYDPANGGYAQSDPIGLLGGLNTYAYVRSNPVASGDPRGLCPFCTGAAGSGSAQGVLGAGTAAGRNGQSKPKDSSGFNDNLFPDPNQKPGTRWPDWLKWPSWLSNESAEDDDAAEAPRTPQREHKRQSKPKGCPAGTTPIDQAKWPRDRIHDVKGNLGAGPRDWVGVDSKGNVWTSDQNGNAVNNGHWTDWAR